MLLICAVSVQTQAQSTVDAVLAAIEKNNKDLAASRQYWEAKKLEFGLGNTLENPTIQGQYLIGSPAVAGNQTDFFAVQPFNLPKTYKTMRALATEQGRVSTSVLAAQRMELLLESKLVCTELVYRNKLKAQYGIRKTELEKLRSDFQTKLDKGDGNILDVNKTKLQLLEVSQLQAENLVEQQKLLTHLNELNGGEILVFTDTIYPLIPEIETFEAVEKAYEAVDPTLKTLQQEKRIAEKQMDLVKSWRLPKFEAGYHHQSILGQRFNGIHAGMTLPFWEHKNRKQAQQAQLLFSDLQLQSHLNEHFFEIKEMYELQATLKKTLDEYSTAIGSVSNTTLLNKALRVGQISTIEYFLEMSFYQNAYLHFLKTEHEYQKAIAQLMQYLL
jgi:outer membrane protein, heavy metal efflux system